MTTVQVWRKDFSYGHGQVWSQDFSYGHCAGLEAGLSYGHCVGLEAGLFLWSLDRSGGRTFLMATVWVWMKDIPDWVYVPRARSALTTRHV